MNFSKKILIEYKENADKRVSFVCRLLIIFMLMVAILNAVNIFKIEPLPLYLTVGITIIGFFLPTLFYDILKIKSNKIRYFILAILVVQSGLLYSVLSYHTILMLAVPLIMACLYSEKRYVLYTLILTIPMVIISHLIAFNLKIVPDEPLVTLKGTIFYGIIPRVIELLGIGVLCFFISDRIEKLINTLANKNKELYDDQENLIVSLSQVVEGKSEDTGQHIKRVCEYTEVLCRALGYSDEDCWKISLAATLHDLGKLMIPEEILEKPGKLTKEEFEIVKKHVDYGKNMLETSPGELFNISTIIAYQHHEKWDGTGYKGLKGEEISPYARCVALVDVFDALVSHRPYKKAWSCEDAYNEIVSQSGKHFDPKVVEAFINNYDKFLAILSKYPDNNYS